MLVVLKLVEEDHDEAMFLRLVNRQEQSQLKNSNLIHLLVWKHKQTIYIFQRLVKAINEGAYSVENNLKHIQQLK